MHKLIMPLTVLLMISCDPVPQVKSVERCIPKIVQLGENTYTGKCRCHNYSITMKYIGRISDSIDYPLSKCNKMVGFTTRNWKSPRIWMRDIFSWIENRGRVREDSSSLLDKDFP